MAIKKVSKPTSQPRRTIFVSYAHEDKKWVEELSKFLAPWLRDKRLSLWDDTQIKPGSKWRAEIQAAIEEARVAVLFVSQDFLSSNFIATVELPAIVQRAKENKIRIAWIAVGPSTVDETPLSQYQALNSPAHPLTRLSKGARDEQFVKIAKAIADALTLRTLAEGLHIIDETTEPLEASLDHRPERKKPQFRVQANYESVKDRISFTGAQDSITVSDLSKLPDTDREFIADLEDSMDKNYKRWTAVRKGLGVAGGALDSEIEAQLNRIAKLMCTDLNAILGFLKEMYKAELEDHYNRYRYICARLHSA